MNARVPFMNLSVAWARLGHPNEGYKGKGGIVKGRRATSGERDIEKGGERISATVFQKLRYFILIDRFFSGCEGR